MNEIVLSGPIQADLISLNLPLSSTSFKKRVKKILLMSDCHEIGKGCEGTNTLTQEISKIFEICHDKNFLLLIEGSTDVLSVKSQLDLVKFATEMIKISFENVELYYTDIRRTGMEDVFWMEDFLLEYKFSVQLSLEDFIKKAPLCDQSLKIKEAISFLKRFSFYNYLEMRFVYFMKKFFSQPNNIDYQMSACNWIMDIYTLYLIMKSEQENVVYYAGKYHITNLIEIFKEIDARCEVVITASSLFSSFCEKNNCGSKDLKKALNLENSRCLILEFNPENFFI